MAPIDNPFTRKKRELQQKEREAIQAQTRQLAALQQQSRIVAQAIASGKSNVREVTGSRKTTTDMLAVLTKSQETLTRLKNLPPSDLEAFPMINESQRLVQQLREAVSTINDPEQETMWKFQIKELEDDLMAQVDRIMAGAAAAPPPAVNPKYAGKGGVGGGIRLTAPGQARIVQGVPVSASGKFSAKGAAGGPGRSSSSGQIAPGKPSGRTRRGGYTPPSLDCVDPSGLPQDGSSSTLQPGQDSLAKSSAPATGIQITAMAGGSWGPPPSGLLQSGSMTQRSAAAQPHTHDAAVVQPNAFSVPASPSQFVHPGLSHSHHRQPADQVVLRPSDDMFSGLNIGDSSSTQAQLTAQNDSGAGGGLVQHHSVPETRHERNPSQTGPSFSSMLSNRNMTDPRVPAYVHQLGAMTAASGSETDRGATPETDDGMGPSGTRTLLQQQSSGARAAALMKGGLSFSMAQRIGSVGAGSNPPPAAPAAWISAAAASADAQGSKKVIKKKTRGVKVGYGTDESETGPIEVSPVIPGQPVPGPEYMEQQRQAALQAAMDQADQAPPAPPTYEQVIGQDQGNDPMVQTLIQQRQAFLRDQLAQGPTAASAMPAVTPAMARSASQTALPGVGDSGNYGQQGTSTAAGSTSSPGTAPAPFQVTSQEPLKDLEQYLQQLSGPIQACQHAATVAAAQLVQVLATGLQQVLGQQAAANERCRGALRHVSTVNTSISQLEAQQAVHVQEEAFDEAARLDTQLKDLQTQRDELQSGMAQLQANAAALSERQTSLVAMQADACTMVSRYLEKLQQSHDQLLQKLEQDEHAEASAVHQATNATMGAVEEARATLASRKAAIAAAVSDVDARVQATTGPLQQERSLLSAKVQQLQEEVARLRAQLRDSEAALANATSALSAVESEIRIAAGQQLAERQALQAQAAQLESQERDVEAKLAQASNQHQGVLSKLSSHAAQRQELAKQGFALKEAAEKLQNMADRIRARVNLDKEATVARQQLRAACDAAAEKLQQRLRDISDKQAHIMRHEAQLSATQVKLVRIQQSLVSAQNSLQPLHTAKTAAAQQKDFRAAGQLQAQVKNLEQEIKNLQEQEAVEQAALSQLQSAGQQLKAEVDVMRSEEPTLRQAAALARYQYLTRSVQLCRKQLATAGVSADVVNVLRSQADMEDEEAQQLRLTWGFDELPAEQSIMGTGQTAPNSGPSAQDRNSTGINQAGASMTSEML